MCGLRLRVQLYKIFLARIGSDRTGPGTHPSPTKLGIEPGDANGKGLEETERVGVIHVEAVLGGLAQLQYNVLVLIWPSSLRPFAVLLMISIVWRGVR